MLKRAVLCPVAFAVAFAVASGASADVREDWQAVADAVRSTGLSDYAAQIEAAVDGLSNDEIERVYGHTDLLGLADTFLDAGEALSTVDEATGGIASRQAALSGRSKSTSGFPDAQGYPTSFWCPWSPERSNADDLLEAVDQIEIVRIALEAAKVIWSGFSRACEQNVIILGEGGNTSVACIPIDVALFAAELLVGLAEGVVEHIAFCDAAVDAAEIEGSYERLGHLHTDWTNKFPGDVTVFRGGHGCNGIDDNASGSIDECAEDRFSPTVHIDAAVANGWYRNLAEASAAVSRGSFAFDDCQTTSVGSPAVGGFCDSVAASVTASDACGNAATASTVVKVDGAAPAVLINPTVASTCVATVAAGEQAVLAATSVSDNCTQPTELDRRLDSTVTECSLRVRQEAIDRAGNRTTAAVTVRSDAERPRVDIDRLLLSFRSEVPGFRRPLCYDTTSQAEGAVLAATGVQDNCSAVEDIGTTVSSNGDPCHLAVTVRGVDECSNDNTDTVSVRVDTEAPAVTAAVVSDQLWPPNHKMIDVGFSFATSDNCDGDLEIVHRVTSDEPTTAGQPSPAPDAEILRDLDGAVQGIRVRAERDSAGDGRVYEISVTATDPCGNTERASAFVKVPRTAVDSGQYYDATAVN